MAMNLYISTDVETDGPIPGVNSMLSLGSAWFDEHGDLRASFSANLHTLPGAVADAKALDWWRGQSRAWAACRSDLEAPEAAMTRYAAWLEGLAAKGDRLIFVAWPVGFDFTFVYWYLIRFAGRCPFGHSALDMRSFAMGLLGGDYGALGKERLPAHWIPEEKHTHVALDDAIEQGRLFANMMRARRDAGGEAMGDGK
jgi:hypothetical protein